MSKKEIRTVVNEQLFTNFCKSGFIKHKSDISGPQDIRFSKIDMKNLATGQILEKETDDVIYKFALQDIGKDLIREIVKRSPIYSELAEEI
jgi:hypothetical protein